MILVLCRSLWLSKCSNISDSSLLPRITTISVSRTHGCNHGIDVIACNNNWINLNLIFNREQLDTITKKPGVLKHSLTNRSGLLILGSLIIGYLANAKQAEGIIPFTNDLFKGFLAIFLLDMGITSGRKLKAFFSFGWFPVVFAISIPLTNGCIIAMLGSIVTHDTANRFMFAILAASASYIAVPGAMKISVTKANPGLFLPMALAVTFPVNITIGMPVYFLIVQIT